MVVIDTSLFLAMVFELPIHLGGVSGDSNLFPQ